ncbi:MAG: hypothetical protein ACREFO_18450 [Acetobacteraceae bacterium]
MHTQLLLVLVLLVAAIVVAPSHYEFSDLVRIGVPFSVIVLVLSVLLVPLLLPLG